MTSKFILVPEDMYQGLMQTTSDNFNLNFVKNKMDNMKNDKKMDSTEKNIKYNQEFRRYLKMKKEAEDKPIKVEVANGPKFVTTKENTNILLPETDNEEFSAVNNTQLNQSDIFHDTSERFESPKTPQTTPSIDNKVRQVLKIINKNPETYGIVKEKIINNNGLAMKNSSVTLSLKRIFTGEGTKPSGTDILYERLQKNPIIKSIIEENSSFKQITPESSGSFKPERWTH